MTIRSGEKMKRYLLVIFLFSVVLKLNINAQNDHYFYLNETLRSVYFAIYDTDISYYTIYDGCAVIRDTLTNGHKYYRINSPFGDEFFRYGLDKKLYCLDSGVEKLFLDLSDTSEISFQGFDPNLNYTVNFNRKLVPNSDILEFSLLSGNPTTKYRFKKGIGLIYHHYYRYDILHNNARREFNLKELSVNLGDGNVIQFTSNVSPQIPYHNISLFNDTSFILRTKVSHEYTFYRNEFLNLLPYIEKVGVEYRFVISEDTTDLIRSEKLNTVADSVNFIINFDPNTLKPGDKVLYRVYATTREPNVRTKFIPSENGYYGYTYTPTGLTEDIELNPQHFTLYQNYPNPFNNGTVIKFYAKQAGTAILTLYDPLASEVCRTSMEVNGEGEYFFNLNQPNLPSQVYLYKVTLGNESDIKKMILLK